MLPGQRFMLPLLLAVMLASCMNRIVTQQPLSKTPLVVSQTAIAAPGSPTQAAAALPTDIPLPARAQVAVPTVTPKAGGALVGAEWQRAYEGDLNQDGHRDVVAFIPATVKPDNSMQPYLTEYPLVASSISIVQESDTQGAQVQVMVNRNGIHRDSDFAGSFGSGVLMPAAFLLQVKPGSEIPVTIIPINAAGSGYSQGVGFYWNSDDAVYHLLVAGQKGVQRPTTNDPMVRAAKSLHLRGERGTQTQCLRSWMRHGNDGSVVPDRCVLFLTG